MFKNKNVDIFIYGVKAFTPLVTNPVYKVLTNANDSVENYHTELPIYRDFDGVDNISDKNLVFNEYTGWYWLWRNMPLKQYVGFNHYRRYFDFLDDVPDINKIFQKSRIILNSKFYMRTESLPRDNRFFYGYYHNIKDFELMESCVKDLYPEYAEGWDKMAKSTHIYPSSIMIMPSSLFSEYMQYIMDVTEEFCDRIGCHTSEDYIKHVEEHRSEYIKDYNKLFAYYTVEKQARVIGYLIERCLCAFLMSGGSNSLENHSAQLPWHVFDVKYNEK